jgi:sugar lactone lactonase YvrE
VILLTLVTGCSSNPLNAKPPTIEPAQAADSPAASQAPAGAVRPLGGHPQAAVFDSATHQLVVLSPGNDPAAPASIALFGDSPRFVTLPGPATALAGDDRGSVYLAARGGYFVVDLAAAHVTQVNVTEAQQAQFTAIARRADGKLALGSADGTVYILGSAPETGSATVDNRIKIFTRVDSLATQGNTTAVLDRGQTSLTTIGADGHAEQALRAGEGATTMAADPQGRVLVADTRGGELLVYGCCSPRTPLILRQAYPVRDAPFGLAGSRGLAWVSQTASNTVIGYDLTTGIPLEKVRYPTVRQPNSLAFDEASGTLYVVSGSGAGVQVIEHAAGPR